MPVYHVTLVREVKFSTEVEAPNLEAAQDAVLLRASTEPSYGSPYDWDVETSGEVLSDTVRMHVSSRWLR